MKGLLATGRVGIVDNTRLTVRRAAGGRTRSCRSRLQAVTFRDERLANLSLQPTAPAAIVRRRS